MPPFHDFFQGLALKEISPTDGPSSTATPEKRAYQEVNTPPKEVAPVVATDVHMWEFPPEEGMDDVETETELEPPPIVATCSFAWALNMKREIQTIDAAKEH